MFQGTNNIWGGVNSAGIGNVSPTSLPGQKRKNPKENQIDGNVNIGTHLQDDKPNQAMRSIGGKLAEQALPGIGGMLFSFGMAKNDEANRWLRPTRKLETVDGGAMPAESVQTKVPTMFAQAGPLAPQMSQEELMRMQMMQQGQGGMYA